MTTAEAAETTARRTLTFCFDIDGTICDTSATNYEDAVSIPEAVADVNRLYDLGNHIVLFSARGTRTGIDWRRVTERQLHEWGVRYHELVLGKPAADVYVDDRAVNAADWKQSGYRIEVAMKADD